MKMILLAILIWSILDSGWSITDEEYHEFKVGLAQIQVLRRRVENQTREMELLTREMEILRTEMESLKDKNQEERVETLEGTSTQHEDRLAQLEGARNTPDERLLTLQAQVTEVQEEMQEAQTDIHEIKDDVDDLQDRVSSIFTLQVRSNGKIDDLEEETKGLKETEKTVKTLERTASNHDQRLVTVEAQAEDLDRRVEVLEANGTAVQHDDSLVTVEAQVEDLGSPTLNLTGRVETLEGETSELETRLTAAETVIEDMQVTYVNLTGRIRDLGRTIAFRAVMTNKDDDNILWGSTVIFSDVQLNVGNGYNSTTGVFAVPPGGGGYYYFATHFRVVSGKLVHIDLRVNDLRVCTAYDDTQEAGDWDNTGCNAVVFLEEGDEVKNVYWLGSDSTPVYEWIDGAYNGFTGFRIQM